MTKIILIAALTPQGVIGRDGEIPWHMPSHDARFRDLTQYSSILMGRKAYGYIISRKKELLRYRKTLVLTQTQQYQDTVRRRQDIPAPSLKHALAYAESSKQLFVTGGQSVYEQLLPYADELFLTYVAPNVTGKPTIEGDAYFPRWDRTTWVTSKATPEVTPTKQNPSDEYASAFVKYEHRAPTKTPGT